MRQMIRNTVVCWYSHLESYSPVLDDDGNETQEMGLTYSEPKEIRLCVGIPYGQWGVERFGGYSEHDRNFMLTGDCPLQEGDRLWIDKTPPDRWDYICGRVATSLSGIHLIQATQTG